MDRVKGTMKIPGLEKFKSMGYTCKEIDKKITKLESQKKHLKNLCRLKQDDINVHYAEYDKLKLREDKEK